MHRIKKILAYVFTLVLILASCNVLSIGQSVPKIVEKFIHASLTADAKTMISLVPREMISSAEEYGIIDSKQSFIEYTQTLADNAKQGRDAKYGVGWRYTFEITQSYEYSDDERIAYLYDYGSWRKEPKSVMDVSVTVIIENDEVIDMTMTLLKIGRKWYVEYLN